MEQTTTQRIRGLIDKGHRCSVLSLNPFGGLYPVLQQHGIPAEALKYEGRFGWRSFPQLYSKLRRQSADALLMTGHNWGATLALGDLAANHRVLSIHYHHSGVLPNWQWRMIYRSACARFQVITFATDFIRLEAERIFPPVARIAVTLQNPFTVPPLPTASEREQARRELGICQQTFVIGNAGWLIERKRFDVFLRVTKQLADYGAPILSLIAGDGPQKTQLQSLSSKLGIADKVRWFGWQKDLRQFYLALDALVFNSDWDALGRTPLEALALGTPLVASVEQGGLSEIITGDEYGFLTNKHDVEWMSTRLLRIRDDSSLADSMVRAARARIAECCCPQRDTDRLANLLGLQ